MNIDAVEKGKRENYPKRRRYDFKFLAAVIVILAGIPGIFLVAALWVDECMLKANCINARPAPELMPTVEYLLQNPMPVPPGVQYGLCAEDEPCIWISAEGETVSVGNFGLNSSTVYTYRGVAAGWHKMYTIETRPLQPGVHLLEFTVTDELTRQQSQQRWAFEISGAD
jgi:hypothetical protein